MVNLITNESGLKNQIEFLIGKEVPLTAKEINSLAHLTMGNLWIIKVLDRLGLTIDDIIDEKDRVAFRKEMEVNKLI